MKDKDEQAPWLLHQAGVKFAIMSDHPEQPIEYLWLYAALAVRTGLPPEAALRAITRNPAEILGLDRRIGTLEKGKDADLLVVSGSLLELSGRIERTMIDGKFV